MNKNEGNFKVVLAIRELNLEKYFKTDVECKVAIGNLMATTKLPLKEALTFDLNSFEDKYRCEIIFEHKNRLLANIQINIPREIDSKEEIELEENFQINTFNDDKKPIELFGKYFLVILNKHYFKKKNLSQTPEKVNSLLESERLSSDKKLLISEKLPKKAIQNQTNKLYSTTSPISEKKQESYSATVKTVSISSPNEKKEQIALSASVKNSSPIVSNEKKIEKTETNESLSKSKNTPKSGHKSKFNKAKTSPLVLEALIDDSVKRNNNEEKLVKDLTNIEDCIYLTKINRDIQNTAEDKSELIINTSYHKNENNDYKEKLELSPESLKKRFNNEAEKERSFNKSNKSNKSHTRLLSPQSRGRKNESGDYSIFVDNDFLQYSNRYKNQNDYLKTIIYSLDMKIRDYNGLQKELEILKLELKKSEEARNELQQTIRETTDELKNENLQIHENYGKIIRQKTEYIENLKEGNSEQQEISYSDNKKDENNVQDIHHIKNKGVHELRAENESIRNNLAVIEKKMIEMQGGFLTKMKDLANTLNDMELQKNNYFNENLKLKQELNNINQGLFEEQQKSKEKENEIEALKKKLLLNQCNEMLLKNMNDQNLYLTKELENKRVHIENLHLSVDNIKTDLLTSTKVGNTKEKKLHENITVLKKQQTLLEQTCNDHNDNLAKIKKENSELKTSVSSLQQLLCLKEDVHKQLEFANDKVERLTVDKEKLKQNVDELTEQLLNKDDQIYERNKLVEKLKEIIREKEEYSSNLKKLILEMRTVFDYVPLQGDPIDSMLALYINKWHSTENKLKILFIREGEGVYQFGTKKIFVAIHQDKIHIRVGGGFLSIEEFLDIYTPLELEKLQRKDPVKIFNQNIAVNKTIAGRLVHEIEKPKNSELKIENLKTIIQKVKP